MKDSVETQEQLMFVLNGKPYVPGTERPAADNQTVKETVDEQQESTS